MRELDLAAAAKLESGAGSGKLPSGVRFLDTWRDRSYGAVLFWVDPGVGLWDADGPVLQIVHCELVDDAWRSCGRGATSTRSAPEIIAEKGPGLHCLGGSSPGDPVRLTHAIASPEVSTIELRNARGVSERRPGVEGFCVLGITHQDPITYAHAVDSIGHSLPSEPLLL